jgi:rod shape-determining protein MreD
MMSPNHHFWQRYQHDVQDLLFSLLPIISLWMVLALTPLHPSLRQLGLPVVFYWAVYRPDMLRLLVVALSGLLLDKILGLPLGWESLLLSITYLLALRQRHLLTSKGFWQFWAGYGVISLLVLLLQIGLTCWWVGRCVNLGSQLQGWLIGLGLLPLICYTLTWVHRCLPNR